MMFFDMLTYRFGVSRYMMEDVCHEKNDEE